MKLKPITKSYITAVIIPLAVGGLSAFITRDSMDVYKDIIKPPLVPPGIVFPIVWTILYVLMGISSAMIYNTGSVPPQKRSKALTVYAFQLAVNFLWSIVFFNMQAYLASLFVLIVLWSLILTMILMFSKINRLAAVIQVPYFLWVTFAGYLNLMIYILNK